MKALIPQETIEQKILLVRGQKVMLDIDLAKLYGLPTKVLNQAVKRHLERFPLDFMFRLTEEEKSEAVTNCDHLRNLKFSSVLPRAFTEHGVVMLANLLNTPRAVRMSIFVVRAFIKLREVLATHKELASKLAELEHKIKTHDGQIQSLFDAIRELMTPPEPSRRRIGFHAD